MYSFRETYYDGESWPWVCSWQELGASTLHTWRPGYSGESFLIPATCSNGPHYSRKYFLSLVGRLACWSLSYSALSRSDLREFRSFPNSSWQFILYESAASFAKVRKSHFMGPYAAKHVQCQVLALSHADFMLMNIHAKSCEGETHVPWSFFTWTRTAKFSVVRARLSKLRDNLNLLLKSDAALNSRPYKYRIILPWHNVHNFHCPKASDIQWEQLGTTQKASQNIQIDFEKLNESKSGQTWPRNSAFYPFSLESSLLGVEAEMPLTKTKHYAQLVNPMETYLYSGPYHSLKRRQKLTYDAKNSHSTQHFDAVHATPISRTIALMVQEVIQGK